MDIKDLYSLFLQSSGVATDSRKIQPGQIFFALKGENFDGNKYAAAALESGALRAVVDKDSEAAKLGIDGMIAVDDVLATLKALARYHREALRPGGKPLTVIGLTGTNGKTTTKELLRCVLSCKYRVSATEGNLNNDIGVPLTLLGMNEDTEIAVVEMGASHPDDISALTCVCEPDCGLVTNVGRGHLQGFGSFEGVKKAKGQLYDYLRAHGAPVYVNVDDPVLKSMVEERPGMKVMEYGLGKDSCTVLASDAEHPYLRMTYEGIGEYGYEGGYPIETHLVGAYNANNVLSALTVGLSFGVSLEETACAIENYEPANKRSQLVRTGRNSVVLDAYNANPVSMAAALDSFDMLESSHKAVMLGDMKELGESSLEEHIGIVRKLMGMRLSSIYLVGGEFRRAMDDVDERFRWFEDSSSLAAHIAEATPNGWLVLVKGSRSMAMEKVVESL